MEVDQSSTEELMSEDTSYETHNYGYNDFIDYIIEMNLTHEQMRILNKVFDIGYIIRLNQNRLKFDVNNNYLLLRRMYNAKIEVFAGISEFESNRHRFVSRFIASKTRLYCTPLPIVAQFDTNLLNETIIELFEIDVDKRLFKPFKM